VVSGCVGHAGGAFGSGPATSSGTVRTRTGHRPNNLDEQFRRARAHPICYWQPFRTVLRDLGLTSNRLVVFTKTDRKGRRDMLPAVAKSIKVRPST
jgi:hypothetical protein